jgi:HPt (histidine-containing phosphotransfer) domain-containing protein
MSDDDRERARQRLHELHARFAVSLRERVAELDALVEAARTGPLEATLAQALAAAHRLAGTAGSFGHPAVGQAAAELEVALGRVRDEPHAEGAWDEIEAALARARACVASAAAPGIG